jgi:hypothetical protein
VQILKEFAEKYPQTRPQNFSTGATVFLQFTVWTRAHLCAMMAVAEYPSPAGSHEQESLLKGPLFR